MASIKVKFRPSTVAGNEGTIYYQIIYGREVRQLHTHYRISPAEWNKKISMISTSPQSPRYDQLLCMREQIYTDIRRLHRIMDRLRANTHIFSIDDVLIEYKRFLQEYTLFNYFQSTIAKLKQNQRIRTAETYQATLNSFRKFRAGEDLLLDNFTPQLMEDYEAWLKRRGISPNTTSFYARVLRALYNRAVDLEIISDSKPFKRVYTGICKTEKRALTLPTIRKIKALNLKHTPRLDYARDMFILSFYLRGMSFIDMAYLQKTDLKNGYITYHRHKTHQKLTILWTKEMQRIVRKYPPNTSKFLLPIIHTNAQNTRYTYRNAAYRINNSLKKIAQLVGISIPLTLYVARHSWASAAKANGIPISVISEGMGHDSETTTRIYLASLETSVIDKANSLIMRSLR